MTSSIQTIPIRSISKSTLLISFLSLVWTNHLAAQEIPAGDSLSLELEEVRVKAYEQNRNLLETPAAIGLIRGRDLSRFGNASILPAVNMVPGVRMDERSPGSYRLSVRGGSIRSPFGVRNIKIYYNDIPFTDPAGHSYLNLLGYYNFQNIEIIKGPGSSVYGAGTGGAMLIDGMPAQWKEGAAATLTGGSFGMLGGMGEVRLGGEETHSVIRYQHLQTDGYRNHTNMRRDVLTWDAVAKLSDKDRLSAHCLYGDLYYQTPGALNLGEYTKDPKAARPGTGTVPGAEEAQAAIYGKTVIAGFSNTHKFDRSFENTTTLYGAWSQLLNPTIRNYGRNSEPHFGGRSVFRYHTSIGQSRLDLTAGGEGQKGVASVKVYMNKNARPDTLLSDDEISSLQMFAFAQAAWEWKKLMVTAGLSVNRQRVTFLQLTVPPSGTYTRDFETQSAPRVAVLYKLAKTVSVYGTVSKGFSPPSSAELFPSGGVLNRQLNAEQGWNYELGSRGKLFGNRLQYDINVFYFKLDNTIVLRKDSSGGDFYVNAGSANEAGAEAMIEYAILREQHPFGAASVRLGYTGFDFHYKDFLQYENDFSGKTIPGVPPHTITAGLDIQSKTGIYMNLSWFYSAAIWLDDANTAKADPYNLAGLRFGFKARLAKRHDFDIFAGADNLLDETYSLGNDINAFGGRHYNAAPGRSFYGGLALSFNR
jgi:iron complex outermembrane receptor protein